MARTIVPPTQPENPNGETRDRETGGDMIERTDKIAPPVPGVARPVDLPVDPSRQSGQEPEQRPRPEKTGL
jgi:hypothetical protein